MKLNLTRTILGCRISSKAIHILLCMHVIRVTCLISYPTYKGFLLLKGLQKNPTFPHFHINLSERETYVYEQHNS